MIVSCGKDGEEEKNCSVLVFVSHVSVGEAEYFDEALSRLHF
jgi:hypothetical protein